MWHYQSASPGIIFNSFKARVKERLKESPVHLLDYVLGLVGEIEVVDGHIRIVE
tara:strand:+ start:1017 stop:1178 length:162 start_codon:yes stop_codon:yes gene_type:complete